MPAARAYAVLVAAQECGELVHVHPAVQTIESGELPGHAFTVWLAGTGKAYALERHLQGMPEVVEVDVDEIDPVSSTDVIAAPLPSIKGESQAVAVDTTRTGSVAATVRVDAARLDQLMHSVGDLLVQRARIECLARDRGDAELTFAVEALGRSALRMQELVSGWASRWNCAPPAGTWSWTARSSKCWAIHSCTSFETPSTTVSSRQRSELLRESPKLEIS
jgi:two-component system chemotaxis sensor kinase CheA